MEKDHRDTLRITALLDIELVRFIHVERMGGIGFCAGI
jgi:hypothetical protein